MRRLTSPQIALIVALLTLGSKFIGFVREIIKANYYGTSYIVDSLNMAEVLPNVLFVGIFAATSMSFMPLFSEQIEKEGESAANIYTSRVINLLLIICSISTLVGIVFSDQLVTFFTMPEVAAPEGSGAVEQFTWFATHGWTGERAELTAFYINVTFSYCLCTSLSGILESYLRYKNVFITPVLSGYVISIMLVLAIIFSHVVDDPRYIVVGSFLGNAIRLLIMFAISRKKGLKYTPDFRVTRTVRHIFTLALPYFIGTSVLQISTFADSTLASSLDTGNIASLNYSTLLINLVVSISGTVIATIIYPKLSQAFTLDDRERFSALFTNGLTISLIIGIPITLATMLYHYDVVRIIFEGGQFASTSTELTSRALLFLAPSMMFIMANGIIMQVLFSKRDMKTSVYTSLVAIAVNVTLDIALVDSLGNAGLALATSLSQMVNTILLLIAVRIKIPGIVTKGFAGKCVRIAFAALLSVGLSAAIFLGGLVIADVSEYSISRTALLLIAAICAVITYALILRKTKIDELRYFGELVAFLRRKR